MTAIPSNSNAKAIYTILLTKIHICMKYGRRPKKSPMVQSGERSHPAMIIAGVIRNVIKRKTRLSIWTIAATKSESLLSAKAHPQNITSPINAYFFHGIAWINFWNVWKNDAILLCICCKYFEFFERIDADTRWELDGDTLHEWCNICL